MNDQGCQECKVGEVQQIQEQHPFRVNKWGGKEWFSIIFYVDFDDQESHSKSMD